MFGKAGFRRFLGEYYPLVIVLVGVLLVSASLGPFENGDTQREFDAAQGVIKWGLPYMGIFGLMMDEPPLGYYIEALWFLVFGSSMVVGAALITLFGLGCVVLVYEIGKVWFGRNAGFLAAVLFAVSPWEFVMSRSFLIDTPCLFFSLLFVYVGVIAIRKGSFRLIVVSGFLFAAAFLTKFYAVFSLIPLVLFFVHSKPAKNPRRMFSWVGAFILPVIVLAFLWYQVFTGQGLFSIMGHQDFVNYLPPGIHPSYLFVVNLLLLYGLGWFFALAAALAVIIGVVARNRFSQILVFSLICLATAIVVVGVDTF